jgi:hypothetical protein
MLKALIFLSMYGIMPPDNTREILEADLMFCFLFVIMKRFLYNIFRSFGICIMFFVLIVNITHQLVLATSSVESPSKTTDTATGIPTIPTKEKMSAPEQKTAEISSKSGIKTTTKTVSSSKSKCAGNLNEPVRIVISSLGIDKCIQRETLNGTSMNTPDDVAAFLAPSKYGNKNVNENGNTFIYGHNKANIFGKLGQIKDGEEIKLVLGDGSEISYTVREEYSMKNLSYYCINSKQPCDKNPSMTSIISQKYGSESLSIMTCAGAYSSTLGTNDARHIIVAVRN